MTVFSFEGASFYNVVLFVDVIGDDDDCDDNDNVLVAGCGKHIEKALKDVPEEERCECPRTQTPRSRHCVM